MKFGVREICDVVFKAKSDVQIGKSKFKKGQPVLYIDSAKTSTVEGAATTVYAQGGKGNSRLIAWEGERTVTFTMEDALISPLGFSILSGAGIVEATGSQTINVHMTSQVEGTIATNSVTVDLSKAIPTNGELLAETENVYGFILDNSGNISERLTCESASGSSVTFNDVTMENGKAIILVDYYVAMNSGVQQLEVTPDKFAGSYYLEASTLFRRQEDGVDMPAQFVIPNVKIQ